jgi:hypothetical protein
MHKRKQTVTVRQTQGAVTGLAIVAAGMHILWPTLKVDAITVSLLVLSVIPWLAPLFKEVELPGGVKIVFQELQRAGDRAQAAGLLAPAPPLASSEPEYSFQAVATRDPNLALAGLRIEIEKRLKSLARSRGIHAGSAGVGRLLKLLVDGKVLTFEQKAILDDMIGLLNSAAHGAEVDSSAASWAVEVGPRLLQSLQELSA